MVMWFSGPSKVGDHCQRNDDCQDALGRAMCIDERCQCITSYHFANETGQCIQARCNYISFHSFEANRVRNVYVANC